MKKFEYKTLHGHNAFITDDKLNELGKEGWEIISYISAHNSYSNSTIEIICVLKREIPEQ
ncbi:MAG: DUF4177 domain-containing protein [Bacteroidetes bacterium]|nr:DUF4177 domain-containing protein [Bacteroidota bacterium]